MTAKSNLAEFNEWIESRYPHQPEFLQATKELAEDVMPVYNAHADYKSYNVLKRLSEPERIVNFAVHWVNDNGEVEINRGWRVQHSGLIGPYKGGLRFHPTVNESVLKFLAFEQSFKNALTGLPMGGAKGGSEFNPKGRSDNEIMRFCQAFMQELQRHIGPQTDVPAGDINVGAREIGYLYGQYRRMHNKFGGSLTGKDIDFGGSHVRTEATGFGLIYMLECVLVQHNDKLEDKRIAISGAGNVALHAALKATELGGRVISLSNSRGCYIKEEGLSTTAIRWAIDNRMSEDNVLTALTEQHGGSWFEGSKPWGFPADIALPCATQNELDESSAKQLIDNHCGYVLEGANMPTTHQAKTQLTNADIVFVPGKAANAGGVALSGMEMSQNAAFERKSFATLDDELRSIMAHIHLRCAEEGTEGERVNYAKGANIAAFRQLANAMVAQGV
ncbi:NADP-specific glutamate dehydrogenase [Alteromonas lipolytica]|uniref:Glutamate dehydrogenase n=1 Tax=Alteromonas lipolytica TaxID=1856405 RepID=A0A1E8FFT9_9ALTE|nr:NADP-specific glutamate dehydrogenase [Alteromonas lipolytica]OFI34817.1 glutamate dehydrogenase [Alteromonas lipolytica]GGF54232.1 glutamate dehydrogenase [Alteromonas lipolytica]